MALRILTAVLFLILFQGSVFAETLDVFFGNKLRAEDVWADTVEWQYPLGDTVKYRIKKIKTGENGVVVEWLLPNSQVAIRIRYVYGRLDFNLPLELISATTWVKEEYSPEPFLAQVMHFTSREKRNEPLTMYYCAMGPCETLEMVPAYDKKGRIVSGVVRNIDSETILHRYMLTYGADGKVQEEISINLRGNPNIEQRSFYNKEGKIYKITTGALK
ncbi:MAG: hypothetical protein Q8P07_02475 [bacterium]|nr:hypothetical protein [bacterium]